MNKCTVGEIAVRIMSATVVSSSPWAMVLHASTTGEQNIGLCGHGPSRVRLIIGSKPTRPVPRAHCTLSSRTRAYCLVECPGGIAVGSLSCSDLDPEVRNNGHTLATRSVQINLKSSKVGYTRRLARRYTTRHPIRSTYLCGRSMRVHPPPSAYAGSVPILRQTS